MSTQPPQPVIASSPPAVEAVEAAGSASTGSGRGVIAFVAGTYPLRSETFVYREVQALRQRGWQVHTVSLHKPPEPAAEVLGKAGGESEPEPTTVYGPWFRATLKAAAGELLRRPGRSLRTLAVAVGDALSPGEPTGLWARGKLLVQAVAGLGLAARLRPRGIGQGVGAIHCHFAHAPTTVGMYAARQLGVPFSFVGHANDLFQRRSLLKKKLQRAAFVSCISHWHRQLYEAIHPCDGQAYPIIRCGVDVDGWRPVRRDGGEVAVVLTVCRLVEKKGTDTLIRALRQLAEQGRGQDAGPGAARGAGLWQLVIAGDGPWRSRLEALAEELGVERLIRWEGAVSPSRVRELMGEADVFALPCRTDQHGDRDGVPVVLMEAMACGLPVVAGELPAIRELVEHERTGLLVDGDDPAAVAGALRRLAERPDLARKLAEAGRQRVIEEFSCSVAVGRLEQALHHASATAAGSSA